MKYNFILLCLFLNTGFLFAQEQGVILSSPDGAISLKVKLTSAGAHVYFIDFKGKQILGESSLGLRLEDADYAKGLKIESVSDNFFVILHSISALQPHSKQLAVSREYSECDGTRNNGFQIPTRYNFLPEISNCKQFIYFERNIKVTKYHA
jgi:hypothetical protein